MDRKIQQHNHQYFGYLGTITSLLIYKHNAIPIKITGFLKNSEQSYFRVFMKLSLRLSCGYTLKREGGWRLESWGNGAGLAVVPSES